MTEMQEREGVGNRVLLGVRLIFSLACAHATQWNNT